jgi:hypothetical protein
MNIRFREILDADGVVRPTGHDGEALDGLLASVLDLAARLPPDEVAALGPIAGQVTSDR